MFGVGGTELLVIAVIALLALGPKRMPAMMKAIGKTVRQLRQATRDLGSQVGIDQVLGDELRDPLGLRGGDAPRQKRGARPRRPARTVREMELPEAGVDLDEARAREDGDTDEDA